MFRISIAPRIPSIVGSDLAIGSRHQRGRPGCRIWHSWACQAANTRLKKGERKASMKKKMRQKKKSTTTQSNDDDGGQRRLAHPVEGHAPEEARQWWWSQPAFATRGLGQRQSGARTVRRFLCFLLGVRPRFAPPDVNHRAGVRCICSCGYRGLLPSLHHSMGVGSNQGLGFQCFYVFFLLSGVSARAAVSPFLDGEAPQPCWPLVPVSTCSGCPFVSLT